MTIKKLTFNDKTNLYPFVDRERQICAEDINEFKAKFNDNIDENFNRANTPQIGYKLLADDFDFSSIPADYSNSIWEVRKVYDLDSAAVVLPANVTIREVGGKLTNFTSITGNNTKIQAGLNQIFDTGGDLLGTWSVDRFYPQWFGAVADGVTDDTIPFQKVLDIGGNINLPKATYLFTTLTLSSNTIINGNGSILKCNGENSNNIYFTNKTNIELKNFTIEGTGVDVTGTGYQYHGIYGVNSTKIIIDNVTIHDMTGGGILLLDCQDSTVKNNYCYNNINLFDFAFGYGNTGNDIKNLICTDNVFISPNIWGINVMGQGENFLISGNTVKNKTQYGIMFYHYVNTVLNKARVINNHVENISHDTEQAYYSGMGMYIQGLSEGTISGNVVIDVLKNRPDTVTNRTLMPGAISFSQCNGIVCTGNYINGSGKDGIDFASLQDLEVMPSIISNNIIRNVGTYGIYVTGAKNLSISGNRIINDSAATLGGILVQSTPTYQTENIDIIGNNIKNFLTGINITKGSATKIVGITVNSNVLYDISGGFFISGYGVEVLMISNNIIKALTIAPEAGNYVITLTSVLNASVQANIATGESGLQLQKGIIAINSENVLVQGNVITEIHDLYYTLYTLGTAEKVYFYNNITDRQSDPYLGDHNIAESVVLAGTTQTTIRVIYRSVIPSAADGTFGVGSRCHNLAPTAGGNAGWICTNSGTPGTWRTFGTIQS